MTLEEREWRPITFQGVTFPATLMGVSILEQVLGIKDRELIDWVWGLCVCCGRERSAPAELGGIMVAIMKCVHPLLLAGVALLLLPILVLPVQITDVLPTGPAGPCSVPGFLIFVPGEFMVLLGLGFSAIRVLELRAARRRARGER